MVKNLKFLLLAAIVLFAGVARADDDDDDGGRRGDRRRDLGEGERECGEVGGAGFRAFKVTKVTGTETDTIVFSFRAFPVPRVRVRYFDGVVADDDIESNDVEEKLEIVAAIPGFFLYTDADATAGFDAGVDTITKRFSLRRSNGNAWAVPVLNETTVDNVKIFKLTVCRKVNDFCFVSYVANDTVTYDGYPLTADAIKFNVVINPNTALVITDTERLAVVIKVHYKDGLAVEDNSEENEDLVLAGDAEVTNDVLIGSTADEIAAYFNWEKVVTVTYTNDTTAELNLISTVVSPSELDFDRRSSSSGSTRDGLPDSGSGDSGSSDSGDFDDENEETDVERTEEDDKEEFTPELEDDAVEGRLNNDKIFVFAIDGSLEDAAKIVWDPDTGTAALTVGTGAADAVSITMVKILIAAVAVLALFM